MHQSRYIFVPCCIQDLIFSLKTIQKVAKMDFLEIINMQVGSECLKQSENKNQEEIQPPLLDLTTVYYFKNLIKKYQKRVGDIDNTRVCSGGLQQYLNKESERQEKMQKDKQKQESHFDALPVNIKLQIFSYLSAIDVCRASRVCQSWREITEDNLLWQGFLERDISKWNTMGHNTNPDIYKEVKSEWSNKEIYLRCSPEINRIIHSENVMFSNLTSMLRYFLPKKTPMFAMFGPGLESGSSVLVRNLMNSPDIQTVTMFPGRFGGVGGGFTLKYQSTQFHLSVLYSAPKYEREKKANRDRLEQNKLLVENKNTESTEKYELVPAVQDFCRTVDGFVYVCDSETDVAGIASGLNELLAMVSERWSATHIPVLVLSAVREADDFRVPCYQVVRQLQLSTLNRPWQVRNCVASNLDGVIDGFIWLSEQTQRR